LSADLTEIWDKSLQLIRDDVGESVFDLWFSPIKPVTVEDGKLVLEIPNRFFKEWIEDYHPAIIPDTLEKVISRRMKVSFRLAVKERADLRREEAKLERRKSNLARKGIHLNPKYTFENFVVGPSNQFAHAASYATCENPGKTYNPLFIYGGVGLGKTHLITAIGNHTIDSKRGINVLFVSSEQFTNEVVSAVRHSKTEELKKKYRSLDMLLLDDIQFIENKTATQEELFHTLNALYDAGKQIVLSSDRSPNEIRQVTDRLRSRFSMGLTADIAPPEIETKLAIIQKKTADDRLVLPEEVAHFIASKIKSNIRDIEGCLIRLGAHSSLTGAPITMDMARSVLKDLIIEDDRPLNVETIMKEVAAYFSLRVADLKSRTRKKDIAQPRQVAMYIARELTGSSLGEIGKSMGGKDHATVIYASKQVKTRREKDPIFDRSVENLLNKLRP
jgi:chromosomal replication initiator protein